MTRWQRTLRKAFLYWYRRHNAWRERGYDCPDPHYWVRPEVRAEIEPINLGYRQSLAAYRKSRGWK